MEFNISINEGEVDAFVRWAFADQLPFATSLALNRTALDFQRVEREVMEEEFIIRRKTFMRRSVKIGRQDFATKSKPEARVSITSPGDRSDIFGKFEMGGTKRPEGRSLAIPEDARRTGAGVVRKAERPKSLEFRVHGRGPKANVFRGKRRTFLIQYHSPVGTGGIYRRTGSGKGDAGDRDSNLDTLYRFTPAASIDRRLKFVETAGKVVRLQFNDNFADAFNQAIRMGDSPRHARRIALADVLGRDRARV